MASISIALNNRQFEILESSRLPDESLGLAAKRLLLSVLEPDSEISRLPAEISRLSESVALVEQRLSVLENRAPPAPVSPSRLPAAQRRGA